MAFQRDYHLTQRLQFKFTPAQMAVFNVFIETTLIMGGCWFASSWRTPAGGIGVHRFVMNTKQETFLATGHWLVTIDCEVRGRGELPVKNECFMETFSAGLAPYSVVSGSAAPFSIFATGAYGQGLQTTIGTPGLSIIQRTFAAQLVMSVSLKFRLTSLNADDACTFSMYSGGGQVFGFDPRRDLGISGGTGWPAAIVGPGSMTALGASALAISTWYQMDMVCSPTTPVTITRLSDSAVVASANYGDHAAGFAADALQFGNDSGDSTHSETSYADIHIC